MAAANLEDAANLTYARLDLRWVANTIRANVKAFIVACSAIVTDATANDRTVGNWLVPLTALQTKMDANADTPLPQAYFNQAVDYIFRLCMAAAYAQSQNRITGAQATAILAAYNANIF